MLKIFICLCFTLCSACALERVVVSIKPIHSLVAAVGAGVFSPTLLWDGTISPHTHALTHKDVQTLQQSTLFIWVGKAYESHLTLAVEKKVREDIRIMEIPGLTLYPARGGGCACDHDHNTYDGHVWLAPHNAKIMVQYFVDVFSQKDPEHASTFQKNGKALVESLTKLEESICLIMQPVRHGGYVAYHDALQYFDHTFGPKLVGVILQDPDLPPTAAAFLNLKNTIQNSVPPPQCLFLEPQFSKDVGEKLAKALRLKIETIDYLGTNIPEGPRAYEAILKALAETLARGLTP
jgi:zinc transport system substrate-binding protein